MPRKKRSRENDLNRAEFVNRKITESEAQRNVAWETASNELTLMQWQNGVVSRVTGTVADMRAIFEEGLELCRLWDGLDYLN